MNNRVTRVAVVTSSRADLSILGKLLAALNRRSDILLSVLATGMHRTNEEALRNAIPRNSNIYLVGADLEAGALGAAQSMGCILAESAIAMEKINPDLVIVTGDRLDMAPVAISAVPFNIPLMHLHGGELTYGAIDDRLRHAMSKLAHIHCTATKSAAARIASMGEEPWRIHVTGAPALDSLLAAPAMEEDEFLSAVGIAEANGLQLVTVHPETNSDNPLAPAEAVFDALADCAPIPTIISAPNSDPGGDRVRSMISAFVEAHSWALAKDTLGTVLYANAMRRASVMVGNSSSGLIEAGLFGLPVVNVGDRQAGRERGDNVIDVPSDATAVAAAIREAVARPRVPCGVTPYGDGRAVGRIMKVITTLPGRRRLLAKQWVEHAA